jgi:FkbM family methyltransferase
MNTQLQLKCPPNMVPHIRKLFEGEYDVPYNKERPVILDIGANVGGFAAWATKRWKSPEIYCYEPMPDNFEMLSANAAVLKQAGADSRIHLNNFAIGDTSHTTMYRGLNNCGESSFFDLGEQSKDAVTVKIEPPSILPRGQILKMDTEGCEIEILSGLKTIDFDVILLEYHSDKNRRMADELLPDYVLVGGEARTAHRGVLKYMHQRLVPKA